MKLRSRRAALVLFSFLAITLTACTSTSIATEETETSSKEAGARGSRICFTNDSDIAMSAAPSGRIVQKNATHDIGVAGPLSADSELCFAGWNSREEMMKTRESHWAWDYTIVDSVVAVSIDGNYNALTFYARNPNIDLPLIYWNQSPATIPYWTGSKFGIGNSLNGDVSGHSFTATRREDSEYFKEFLVRFTQ
jgi:hypothetical protein